MSYQFKQSIKFLIVIAIILNGCSTKKTSPAPSTQSQGSYISSHSATIFRSKAEETSEVKRLYSDWKYNDIYEKLKGYKNANSDDFVKDLIIEFRNISDFFSVSAIYMNDKSLFEYIYEIAMTHEKSRGTKDILIVYNEIKKSDWRLLVDVMRCYLNNKQQKEWCKQKVNDDTLRKLFDKIL